MSLLADQMSERRERILQSAREIIGEHGFEGLTMRELAQAAGVTVPTIYNLIGSKDEVLVSAVAEQTERFVQGIERAAGDLMAIVDANTRELLRMPSYYRSLLRLMLRSDAAAPAFKNVEDAVGGQVRLAVGELAEEGGIEDWADLDALRNQIQSTLWMTSLHWANHQLSSENLETRNAYGTAMLMLAVTRGEARDEYARIVRDSQPHRRRIQERTVTSLESHR
jgi:AcrR family transcriptional regulator